MNVSERQANERIQKRIGSLGIAPTYAEAINLWPEVRAICKTEINYLEELAIVRLHKAAITTYGRGLDEYLSGIIRKDLVLIEKSFRVCAALPQHSLSMEISHIPAYYLYRCMQEEVQERTSLADPVLRLLAYNAYAREIPPKFQTDEACIDYTKTTGFSVYPRSVISTCGIFKGKLIQELQGEQVEVTPQYSEFKSYLNSLDVDTRRYIFASNEESILEFLSLAPERRSIYAQICQKEYPWGLPAREFMQKAVKDISYLVRKKHEKQPTFREDDSLPPMQQGIIGCFFGACYTDVCAWFGQEADIARKLKNVLTNENDITEYPEITPLYAILKVANTSSRIRYICRLRENMSAYIEFERNYMRMAMQNLGIDYIKAIIHDFPVPAAITAENLRLHFINYIFPFDNETSRKNTGYDKYNLGQCINYENAESIYFILILNNSTVLAKRYALSIQSQNDCKIAAKVFLNLSEDAKKYFIRQGVATFISLVRRKKLDTNSKLCDLEEISKKHIPYLRESFHEKHTEDM